MNASEFPVTTSFPSVRANKIAFGTYRGYLTFRNVLGRLFTLATEEIVTSYVPVTTDTIQATPLVTAESVFVAPAGGLAAMTFTLPAAVNSRVGMIRRLQSTQAVTPTFTVNVNASGTIAGATLTTLVANTPYAWQCTGIAGTVATWTRIL